MTAPAIPSAFRWGTLALLVVAFAGAARAADDPPADTETAEPSVPYFHEIIWTGSAYVGVIEKEVETSADGIAWQQVHASEDNVLCVAAGNGRVVAAGYHRIAVASGTGPALSFTSTAVPDTTFMAITFADGKFVAVDSDGRAHISKDGAVWQVATIAAGVNFDGVAYGYGTWVVVGGDDALYYAKDPAGAWTHVAVPANTGYMGSVAFGHGGFLVSGADGALLESKDGVTWTLSDALASLSSDASGKVVIDDFAAYVFSSVVYRRLGDGGEWEALPDAEYYEWRDPVVRDGQLRLVAEGPTNRLVSVDDAIAITNDLNAAEGAGDAEENPPRIDIQVEHAVRLTAFDGATVNRLAAGEDAVYAATTRGLFKSADGRSWERVANVTMPVDCVAATHGAVVIATKDGLSELASDGSEFQPIANGRFKVRDLRGAPKLVAALGDDATVHLRDAAGEWHDVTLEDATNVLCLAVDDDVVQMLAETPAGIRQFFANLSESWSYWTPLRGVKMARVTENGLALFESSSGVRLGEIPGKGQVQQVDVPGKATDLIAGWLVTSRGLIAGISADDNTLWSLYNADGAALTTIADAGSSVIAAGTGGTIVIVPKPADDAPPLTTLPSVAVDLKPTDLKLPADVRIQLLDPQGAVVRVKSDHGRIYGLKSSGQLVAWGDSDWGEVAYSPDYADQVRDVVVAGDTVAAINGSRLFESPVGGRSSTARSWGYSTNEDRGFQRLFHDGDSYLLLAHGNEAGSGPDLPSLDPRFLSSAKELRDAARGNGVWVIVGSSGDNGEAPGIFVGVKPPDVAAAAVPVSTGSLHAVLFDGRRFVAVGDAGNVLTSDDSSTWQARQIPGAPALREIAFGAKQYGTITEDGAILVSEDLATWRELPRDPLFVFRHIAATADILWAIGDYAALACRAPVSVWQDQPALVARAVSSDERVAHVAALTTDKIADGKALLDLTWDGAGFIACADGGVWASADGATFTKVRDLGSSSTGSIALAFGKVWMCTEDYLYSGSPGGRDLSNVRTAAAGDPLVGFAAHEETLVYASKNGDVTYTADRGATWQDAPRPGLASLTAIAFGGGRWLAAGTRDNGDTAIAISTDLQAWKLVDVRDHRGGLSRLVYGNDRFVGSGGTPWSVAVSSDGESWDALQFDDVSFGTTAVAGGRFYLARNDRLYVSADGRAWRNLDVKPEASVTGLTAMRDTLYLFGRGYSDVNYVRLPVVSEAQLAAASPVGSHPVEGIAQKVAVWDAAMSAAKSSAERLSLCAELCRAWRDLHPHYTKDEALAFIDGMYERVLTYETNETTVYEFVSNLGDFSSEFMHDYLEKLPAEHRAIVKQIANDILADFNARSGGSAPAHGARVNAHATPAQAQKSPAEADIAQLRLRAARDDKLAAYALSYYYRSGIGVPLDAAASQYWAARARKAGFDFPEGPQDTPARVFAAWKFLADQGSAVAENIVGERYRDAAGVELDYSEAARWFKLASTDGNWGATVNLARAYRTGQGVACDLDASRRLLEQASALGSAVATAEIGWCYEAGAGVKRDLAKALDYYQQAADHQMFWAMRRIGEYYFAGHGVAQDAAKARALFQQAADAGDPDAKTILADIAAGKHQSVRLATYVTPKPRRPVFDVAARRAKAEAGDAAACYDMADATWNGYGVVADKKLGDQWLARAKAAGWKEPADWNGAEHILAAWRGMAEQGSLVAMDNLARCLRNGTGAPADLAASNAMFLQAADAGDLDAQAEMGIIYEAGRDAIAADPAQSFAWYHRAADGGHALAQVKTGYRYETGRGVKQDGAAAVRYYRLAAEGGNAIGAANLASMLTLGSGTAPDPKAAAGWYLELAGLPNEPTDPAVAYAQIKAALADGELAASAPLAIMTRRGFGTTVDVTEAWALANAAEYFESEIYDFNWFDSPDVAIPVALRRSAQLMSAGMNHAMGGLTDSETEAKQAREKLSAAQDEAFTQARDEEKSEIARALRALEAGIITDEQVKAAVESLEPLRLYGLAKLRTPTNAPTFPANQPWTLRLAGITDAPADAAAAEELFIRAAVAAPGGDDDNYERTITLRAIEAARLYYGVGVTKDVPAALAWAMFNDAETDSYFPILFLSGALSPEELARADARYYGLEAETQRLFVDDIDQTNEGDRWTAAAKTYRDRLARAADAGDVPSLVRLASDLEAGSYGFTKDAAQSYAASLKAAQRGDVASMIAVGSALDAGTGVAADPTEAKAWFEKAAATGEPHAVAALGEFNAAAARAAQRTSPDQKVGPVDETVFAALTELQNDAATATLGQPAILALLKAVWWDADYSVTEEDLARELNAATRPVVITSADGHTLSFTKTVDPSIASIFPQYLQGEFNVLNGNYYQQVWAKTAIVGVLLGGCHVNDNGRTIMRQTLAQNIFDGVRFNANQGGASFEQIFTTLKAAHDAANPTLQAEFRGEIHAAIGLIEQQGIYTVPGEYKNAAWLTPTNAP